MICLIKCVFSIVIMIFHSYAFGIDLHGKMNDGWIGVEVFLAISGYYAMRHFENREYEIDEAISYAYRKIFRIYPKFAVATLICIILELSQNKYDGIHTLINQIHWYSTDFLLITSAFNRLPLLAPMWYLSALLFTLPLLCVLLYSKKVRKIIEYYFSWLIPVLFYYNVPILSERSVFVDCGRAFCSLMIGVFVFRVATIMKQIIKNIGALDNEVFVILTTVLLAVVCFLIWESTTNICFYLILFVVLLSAAFCLGESTSVLGIPIQLLRYFSINVFLSHWIIGNIVERYMSGRYQILIYVMGVIICAGIISVVDVVYETKHQIKLVVGRDGNNC